MTTNIGGISVSVGADIQRLIQGFEVAKSKVKNFQQELSNIKLAAVVKGNPFAETNNYLKASEDNLSKVFDSWKKNMGEVKLSFNKFAENSGKAASTVIKQWEKVSVPFEKLKEGGRGVVTKALQNLKKEIALTKKYTDGELSYSTDNKRLEKQEAKTWVEPLQKNLEQVKGISKEINYAVANSKRAMAALLQDPMSPKAEKRVFTSLQLLSKRLSKEQKKVIKDYEEFGKDLKKAVAKTEGGRIGSKLVEAKSSEEALKRRKEALQGLIIDEKKLRTEIKLGFDVERNRERLAKNYEERVKIGAVLSVKQIDFLKKYRAGLTTTEEALKRQKEALEKLNIAEKRHHAEIKLGFDIERNRERLAKNYAERAKLGFKLSPMQEYHNSEMAGALYYKKKAEEKAISAENQALAKRNKLQKETILNNKRYRTEILLNIDVDKNRASMIQGFLRLQELGIKLTKKQVTELKKLRDQIKKPTTPTDDGFLSAKWFKERVRWFIQLRLLWSAWRRLGQLFDEVRKFETEIANLQAVTQASEAQIKSMGDTIKTVASNIGIGITTIAQGMVKIGQSGFSVSQASGMIKDVSTLAVATITDIATAADLTTTVMKAWEEQFLSSAEVTDVLANTVNNSKANIKGLAQALQYVTGVAPQLDIEFHKISAVIGTLANRGIKMSKIGTGIRSLLGELIRPSKRFEKELFKVGLTLMDADVTTRGFIPVLKTLGESGFNAASAFRGLDRRAASAVSAIIKNSSGLDTFAEDLQKIGSSADMAAVQMETLEAKTIKAVNKFVILSTALYDKYKPLLKMFVDGLGSTASSLTFVSKKAGWLVELITNAALLASLAYMVKTMGSLATKFASLSKGLKILGKSLMWLKSPQVLLIIALGSAVIYLTKAVYGLFNATGKAKKNVEKTSKATIEATAKQEDFNRVSEKYIKLMRDGDVVNATRLSKQNEELEVIHNLTIGTDDYNKKIEEQNALLKKNTGLATENEIAAKKVELTSTLKDLELRTKSKVIPVFNPLGKKSRKEYDADIARLQKDEVIDYNEKDTKKLLASVRLYENLYVKLEAQGKTQDEINGALELEKKAILKHVEKSGKSGIGRGLKEFETKFWKRKEDKAKTEGIWKNWKIDSSADPEIAKEFIKEKLASQPKLQKYLDNNKEINKQLNKLLLSDISAGGKVAKKLADVLNLTDVEVGAKLLNEFLKDTAHVKKIRENIATTSGRTSEEVSLENIKRHLQPKLKGLAHTDIQARIEKILSAAGIKKPGIKEPEDKDKHKLYILDLEKKTKDILAKKSSIEKALVKNELERVKAVEKYKDNSEAVLEITCKHENYANAIKTIEEESLVLKIKEVEFNSKLLLTTDEYLKKELSINNILKERIVQIKKQHGDKEEAAELIKKERSLAGIRLKQNTIEANNYKVKLNTQNKIHKLSIEQTKAGIKEPENKLKVLQIEERVLRTKIQQYDAINTQFMPEADKLKIAEELDQLNTDALANAEAQRRQTDWQYDVMQKLKAETLTVTELWSNVTMQAQEMVTTGFTNIGFNIVSGFQNQRQKAAELKQELKSTKEEYKEAVAAGDSKKVAQLSDEMSRLKREISNVKDPIKTVMGQFKDLTKSVIDDINKMIIKWLIFKAIMTGLEALGFGGEEVAGATETASRNVHPFKHTTSRAAGGIIPQVEQFKAFSSGGLTSRPTLALLGDNKSKTELVIPSENIKHNSVSGYVRDTESETVPITIVNVLTPDDVLKVVGGGKGTRMITNMIGNDMSSKRGVTYRSMRA